MYNKIFTKILDSSIWLEDEHTRLVWLTLLASMDEDGFACYASAKNLSHRARVPEEQTNNAVKILESPDEHSSDPDNDGRRIEKVPGGWMVLNSQKYKDLVTREEIKRKTRERVARFRNVTNVTKCNADPVTCNAPVTQSDTDTDTDTKKSICRAGEVLNYLNDKTGKKFQSVQGSLKFIEARLREGATVEQCRSVIDLKCLSWLKDSKMKDYLRPQTLFNSEKFAAYVGEIGSQSPKQNLKEEWDNFQKDKHAN